MTDILYAVSYELAEELKALLPKPYYAEHRRADPTLGGAWRFNRIWIMSPVGDDNQVEVSFEPERISVSTYTGRKRSLGCHKFEYGDPSCIDEIIAIALGVARLDETS